MPAFQVLPTALLALVALSAATPTYTREQRDAMVNLLDTRSTFTITQVANSKGTAKRRGAADMLRTMKKYGSTTISQKVASAAAAAESGTVTATPEEYDVEYLCPVTVGDQVLELDFDTGSADLWVFSSLLSSSEQSGHTVYDVSHGTLESGESWSITYADESGASGTVYADTVVVGGVTATSQAVEAATSVSSSFEEDTDSDGLLGLAFSSINTVTPTAANTFFDNVKANLASPLFTADLKKGAAGTYDFGFIDTSKYTGDITYTDVDDSDGYWGFTAGGYAVGSSSSTSGSIGSSIMDTGTTLWYLPSTVVEAYYADVSGAQDSEEYGGYVFDCSATLPDMTVEIGGTSFTVTGTYINYETIDSSTCYGGIQSNSGTDFAIFGDVFIKSKFVVFDSSGPQLGIAAQAS